MSLGGAPSDGATPSSFRLGPYTCVERLGTGPIGETFRAKIYGLAGLESQFAVKRLHARLAGDDKFVTRLGAVVRLQARLAHEGIARMEELESEGAQRWLVGEFIHGLDLGRLLGALSARRETLAPDLAAAIVLEAARAVAYAHGRTDLLVDGIVHSGLCLRSLLVSADGRIKVVNFGLLRALAHSGWRAEAQGVAYVPYLAPEVLQDEPPQIASDVWSLGAILWELACGAPPFAGRAGDEVLAATLHGPGGAACDPDCGGALGEIARRCLAVAPPQRFPSASALAEALLEHLGARAEEARANLERLANRLIPRRATGAHRVPTPTPILPSASGAMGRRATGSHRVPTPTPTVPSSSGPMGRWRDSDPGRGSGRSWSPPRLTDEEAAARAAPALPVERRSSRITGQFAVPEERRSRITLPMGIPAASLASPPSVSAVRERRDTVPMRVPVTAPLPSLAAVAPARAIPSAPAAPGSARRPTTDRLVSPAPAPRATASATARSERARSARPTGPSATATPAPPPPAGAITWEQPDGPPALGPPRRLTPRAPDPLQRDAELVTPLPPPRPPLRPPARATPAPPPIEESPPRPAQARRLADGGMAPQRTRPVPPLTPLKASRPSLSPGAYSSLHPGSRRPEVGVRPAAERASAAPEGSAKVVTDLPLLASLDEPAAPLPRRPPEGQQREPVDPSQHPQRGSTVARAAATPHLDPEARKRRIEIDPTLAAEARWPLDDPTFDPSREALSAALLQQRLDAHSASEVASRTVDETGGPTSASASGAGNRGQRFWLLLLGFAALLGLAAIAAPWFIGQPAPSPREVSPPSPAATDEVSTAAPPPEPLPTAPPSVLLAVASTPPAELFVDGAPSGQTPASVGVAPGRHHLVLAVDGRKLLRRDLEVPATGLTVAFPLAVRTRLPLSEGSGGFLRVHCATVGELRLYVDGFDSGVACPNRNRIAIAPGRHRIGLFNPQTGKTQVAIRTVVPSDTLTTNVQIRW